MKRATITLLILLACALSAFSQTYTRLGATQQVLTPDNKPDTSAYLTVVKVVFAGQPISLSPKTYYTDSSGYFLGDDGARGIRLRTNAQAWIYSPITIVPGISRNPLAGTQYTVPAASATQLEELIYTMTLYGTKGEIVVGGATGKPTDFGPCVNGEVLQWDSTQTLGVKCATVQASDADLTAIAALTPNNDDIIQRKAGAWTNRTMAQLAADVGPSITTLGTIVTLGGNLGIGVVPTEKLQIEWPSGNKFFLMNSIGGVLKGGFTSKDSPGGEMSWHANFSIGDGAATTYSRYDTNYPALFIDLLPRWDEISFWRGTGPNGAMVLQKTLWTVNSTDWQIGTPADSVGAVNSNLIFARQDVATAGSQKPSNKAHFQVSVWDTTNTIAETRAVSLQGQAGSGADTVEPYWLGMLDNNGAEFAQANPLTKSKGFHVGTTSNLYPGITIKSQGFRNVGHGLNTPSGITFQNRQNGGNTAGVSLSDDDLYLAVYTWDGAAFQPRLNIVAASGNVGIGTTGPDRKLDVLDAASPQLRLTHTDGSAYTDLQSNASGNLTVTPSGGLVNLGGGLAMSGTPQTLTGPGAVNLTTFSTLLVTTGADALTLAAGAEGQYKFIRMKTDGGDGTLTVTNLQGGTTITFNDAGDFVLLFYQDGRWHILTNSGCVVA